MNIHDLDIPFSNLELIEDFGSPDEGSDPVVEVVRSRPPSVMPTIVHTPTGDEVVPMDAFEEQTKVYHKLELEMLLAAANAHKHPTVPCMAAVSEE